MPNRRPQPRPNDDEMPGTFISGTPNKHAEVVFDLVKRAPYLVVKMSDAQAQGVVDGNQQEGYYLKIKPGDHWEVTFKLSSNWRWSFDSNPIAFKKSDHGKHYKMISQSAQQLVVQVKSPYDSNEPEPWEEEDQPFNLYVLMSQSNTKVYPMTIDPDVKNPPLGGVRRSQVTSDFVPLA